MAEFILKTMVKKQGLEKEFEIASAATSAEETGNPVYLPAKAMLLRHGISSDGKMARQMTAQDYALYDYIIAMDKNNLRNLRYIIRDDPQKKISLLMNYTDAPRDVADPWYTGDFETTWRDVNEGCSGLLEYILLNDTHD